MAGGFFTTDPQGKPRFSILMCQRHLFSSSRQKTQVSLFVIYLGLSFFFRLLPLESITIKVPSSFPCMRAITCLLSSLQVSTLHILKYSQETNTKQNKEHWRPFILKCQSDCFLCLKLFITSHYRVKSVIQLLRRKNFLLLLKGLSSYLLIKSTWDRLTRKKKKRK